MTSAPHNYEVEDDRDVRRARILLIAIPVGALLAFVLIRLALGSSLVTAPLAGRIALALSQRTGASVQLSGVRFKWNFAPCLTNLRLERSTASFGARFETEEACVERWASALGSGFRAVRIRLKAPTFEVEGRKAAATKPKTTVTSSTSRAPKKLRELQIVFDDLRLRWDQLPLPNRFADGGFGPIDGTVTAQVRGDRSAALFELREPRTNASVQGRLGVRREGVNVSAAVEGDLVPMVREFLDFGRIDIKSVPMLGRVGIDYQRDRQHVTMEVDLEERDVNVASEVVAGGKVGGFDARQKARIDVDLADARLVMNEALLEFNGVPLELGLTVSPGDSSPRFDTQLNLRTISMRRILEAVPREHAVEVMAGISPSITFAASAQLTGELGDPATWDPKLNIKFRDVDASKVFTGLEYLQQPFDYHPLTKTGRKADPLKVGPGTEKWVPFKKIPRLLYRSIIISEDATFPSHNGLEVSSLQAALRRSVETGERLRGGSTITQQLVKNMFLSRERTAMRKVVELALTFHLENSLSKEDIFALYANLIEWGRDIYGVDAAAHHYFGRPVQQLEPREIVFLATAIPSPVRADEAHMERKVRGKQRWKMKTLLERLHRLGDLNDQQLARAFNSRINFGGRPTRRKSAEPPPAKKPNKDEKGQP